MLPSFFAGAAIAIALTATQFDDVHESDGSFVAAVACLAAAIICAAWGL